MERHYIKQYSQAVGRDMEMLVFGHYGEPVIAFPSGGGRFFDFEDNGMIHAIAHLIEAGKIKVYCPDGIDRESWLAHGVDPHWRGYRHNAYQDYIVKDLVPTIEADCQFPGIKIALTGCSFGAFHSANFALKFPFRFHHAICMSGRYNMEEITGHSGSPEVYYNNPLAYVANLHGEMLEHIRHHTHLALICGQGAFEDKCLQETNRLADLLAEKRISHERDIWGHDVEHHWYWWRKQLAHHLNLAFSSVDC